MTKTGISEKLRHYSTLLAASLFVFVCVCPFVGFSDGSCYLEQSPNGQFVIRCEGDGIWYNYVDKTNEIYIIENCEALKSQLVSSVDSISDSLWDSRTNYLHAAIGSLYGVESLVNNLYGDDKDVAISSLQDVRSDLLGMDSSLDGVDNSLSSLRADILSINCGSCSSVGDGGGGGSCCDVDLTPVLEKLNDAQRVRISMTNMLSVVYSVFTGTFGTRAFNTFISQGSNPGGRLTVPTPQTFKWYGMRSSDNNVLNNLNIINENIASAGRSINNYLYKIGYIDLLSISNNVEVLTESTTNFFSFFITNISVKSVLGDWVSGSYYDFLTNHYIKVSRDDFDGMSESQQSKTNWFARIETLIASLVFADSVESTNTVDSARAESESSSILSQTLDGVDGVKDISSSQLTVFQNTSQNIISSLRTISSSFSSVADPGTVNLVRLSSSDARDSSDVVSFETSDIRNLVEACHCVTTLCWCLGGLLLLYYFLHWTVKTSYGLVMFAWGVFSAIFKH